MCARSGWLVIGVFARVLNTYVRTHGGVNGVVHPRRGHRPTKATTIHESGMCLGIIHTTWDTLVALFTAVHRACS